MSAGSGAAYPSQRASPRKRATRMTSCKNAAMCRQVFGLVDAAETQTSATYCASLPRGYPVLLRRVVSTYRCGAVPDSHRIPFSIFPLTCSRKIPTRAIY